MNIIETEIPGVLIIEPKILGDIRGYFLESFRESWLREAGIEVRFVQDNISRSRRGTLRGLHYQLQNPQAKLVSATRGEILDIAVDVRKGSPTFGKYVTCLLTEENRKLMYIPAGFAHGFQVLSESADFSYKCSDYYHRESERGISALDSDLQLPWTDLEKVMSDRDVQLPTLGTIDPSDLPVY